MRQLLIFLSFIVLFLSCKPKKEKSNNIHKSSVSNTNYNLDEPTQSYILPNKLQEISGLSFYQGQEIACVNDEKGKIFIYNLSKKEITNIITFGKEGDYEGIELVENVAYILRSDGKIKAINIQNNEEENFDCALPDVFEYEGLGYDLKSNCLLLAAKEMKKGKSNKQIYFYNLREKSIVKQIEISENAIDKNEMDREFKPSGIAVHPVSGQIYVIASSGKKMLVLSSTGEKVSQYNLNSHLFKQPEGICFMPTGNLLISSEGGKGNGYILEFKPL